MTNIHVHVHLLSVSISRHQKPLLPFLFAFFFFFFSLFALRSRQHSLLLIIAVSYGPASMGALGTSSPAFRSQPSRLSRRAGNGWRRSAAAAAAAAGGGGGAAAKRQQVGRVCSTFSFSSLAIALELMFNEYVIEPSSPRLAFFPLL